MWHTNEIGKKVSSQEGEGNHIFLRRCYAYCIIPYTLIGITHGMRSWQGIREAFADTREKIVTQWFPCTSFLSIVCLIFVCSFGVLYFKKQKSPWLKFLLLLMAWSVLTCGVVIIFPFQREITQSIDRMILPGLIFIVMLAGGALAYIRPNKQQNPRSLKTWFDRRPV